MKGIILAGGHGTRLYPTTTVVSKHLLPIYDKPMVYYPLSILMLTGLRDILIITTPEDIENYKKLLGDGSQLGCNFQYVVQQSPKGLAEAFVLGADFIGNDSVCLILGDNIFYSDTISDYLDQAAMLKDGAIIFGYPVSNPSEFGVALCDSVGNVQSIEEKPKNPKSNLAVPGLYFYDNTVVDIAKKIQPSSRGELEITAVNNEYLKNNKLQLIQFGRGVSWLDTGTPKNMLLASNFVEIIQERQGYYISCIEEIAYRKGFITLDELRKLGENQRQTAYGQYILDLVDAIEKADYK